MSISDGDIFDSIFLLTSECTNRLKLATFCTTVIKIDQADTGRHLKEIRKNTRFISNTVQPQPLN